MGSKTTKSLTYEERKQFKEYSNKQWDEHFSREINNDLLTQLEDYGKSIDTHYDAKTKWSAILADDKNYGDVNNRMYGYCRDVRRKVGENTFGLHKGLL